MPEGVPELVPDAHKLFLLCEVQDVCERVGDVPETLGDVLDRQIVCPCLVEEVARKVTVALVQPRRVGSLINDNVNVEVVVYANLQEASIHPVLRVFEFRNRVRLYPGLAKQHSQEAFQGVLNRVVPQDVNVIETVLLANEDIPDIAPEDDCVEAQGELYHALVVLHT